MNANFSVVGALLPSWSWSIDGWIIAAGILSAVSAALLGNFLVLRRMSMLGDAISHAVLPGLATAYLLTDQRSSVPMFIGAVVVGLLTAFFTEWIHRYGEVDEGASLGVVFTSLFAIGLVMIVQAADHVDLDPGCVLHGSIETITFDRWNLGGWEIPRVVVVLSGVLLVNAIYVICFFKELRIASFDPGLATTSGIPASWMHYSLVTLVAVTAVASFESVGNILVVAMLVAPAAAARLLTDRLSTMVLLSVVISATSAVMGHLGAITVPGWFGLRSIPTAGMMAVSVGVLFGLALLFAPEQGIVAKAVRRVRLSLSILREDVLGALFRANEQATHSVSPAELCDALQCNWLSLRLVLGSLRQRGLATFARDRVSLTDQGNAEARGLVRSHRLWEQYLVEKAGLPTDRIHLQAERFEHITDRTMRDRLDQETSPSETDPHGSQIPDESRGD